MQNTGLLEAGDALRGTAVRMSVPLPVVVTARGYAKMEQAGLSPDTPLDLPTLTRADVDSVALLTEPTLAAWGIPFERCEDGHDPADAVARAVRSARADQRPVAVVMARTFL